MLQHITIRRRYDRARAEAQVGKCATHHTPLKYKLTAEETENALVVTADVACQYCNLHDNRPADFRPLQVTADLSALGSNRGEFVGALLEDYGARAALAYNLALIDAWVAAEGGRE